MDESFSPVIFPLRVGPYRCRGQSVYAVHLADASEAETTATAGGDGGMAASQGSRSRSEGAGS